MKTSVVFISLLASLALPPLAHAQTGWAVTTSNQLISFGLSAPATTLSATTITGLRQLNGVTPDPFGQILDLAQRDGLLYGLDANANFYSLNSSTGTATFLSNALSPVGFDGGLAYDSFFGQFRFVSDAGDNSLISTTGTVTNGTSLFYSPSDANAAAPASFVGVAIDLDFGTGFALDAGLDTLAMTFDPNFAEFFTIGSLGFDITGLASMDILNGSLYAALSSDATTSGFYSIDATTGTATLIGNFANGITGLAITPASAVPEPATYGLFAGAAALTLALYRRRSQQRRA